MKTYLVLVVKNKNTHNQEFFVVEKTKDLIKKMDELEGEYIYSTVLEVIDDFIVFGEKDHTFDYGKWINSMTLSYHE